PGGCRCSIGARNLLVTARFGSTQFVSAPSALFLAFSPQFFRPAWRRAAQWSGGKVFGEPCERGWKSFHAEVYRGLAHSGAPVIIAKARASWIFIKTAAP